VTENELKSLAGALGFKVIVAEREEDLYINKVHGVTSYSAYISPSTAEIGVSGTLPPDDRMEALAHEVGHALQWRDGAYSVGTDPIKHFNCEMDAIKRAEELLGKKMYRNYWANYHGYMDRLGLDHMGRS
jgi:hypothetical protein